MNINDAIRKLPIAIGMIELFLQNYARLEPELESIHILLHNQALRCEHTINMWDITYNNPTIPDIQKLHYLNDILMRQGVDGVWTTLISNRIHHLLHTFQPTIPEAIPVEVINNPTLPAEITYNILIMEYERKENVAYEKKWNLDRYITQFDLIIDSIREYQDRYREMYNNAMGNHQNVQQYIEENNLQGILNLLQENNAY